MSDRSVRVEVLVNPRAGTADRLVDADGFAPLIDLVRLLPRRCAGVPVEDARPWRGPGGLW